MKLYHITKPEYVFSILTKGLIPNYKHGMTGGGPRKDFKRIWLTDNPNYIIERQVGDSWPYKVLSVDCTDLEIEPYKVYFDTGPDGRIVRYEFLYGKDIDPGEYEFLHNNIIPPERIALVAERPNAVSCNLT